MKETENNLMDKIVSLAKRRGFVFPGSAIYGGLANSWDYGPLGTELKNNIRDWWWKRFVQQRGDMVGLDAAIIMNPEAWKASGHVEGFQDPLVECVKCKRRFRADHAGSECPECGEKTLHKLFTPVGIHFKGPGFYSTDHGSGSRSNGKSKSEPAKDKDSGTKSSETSTKPDKPASSED